MISNKVKAALKLGNIKALDFSQALSLKNPQALSTKYLRESFKAQELIILANMLKCKLAIIDENNQPLITFDETDIKESGS